MEFQSKEPPVNEPKKEEPKPLPKPVLTMKEAKPEEYKKLKLLRRQRRQARLTGLKKLGYRPNHKLSKDKKTGASLKEVQV